MAIPLYVPEEYGPSTPSRTWSQPQQPSSLSSSSTSAPSCASFVHQLIVELCSIYRESCAATTASADGQGRDVNNNSRLELIQRPQRRRRHPAGASGARCNPHEMVPLPTLIALDDGLHHADRQRQHSEFECKLSVETNFGSIGLQLRQIADSYTIKNPRRKDYVSPSEFPEELHSPRNQASWHSAFKVVGSILFLSFSVTATVVFIKSK